MIAVEPYHNVIRIWVTRTQMMSDRAETKRTVSRTTDLLGLAAMGLVSLVMLTIFLHQRPDGPTQLNTIRDCRDSDFAQTAPLPHGWLPYQANRFSSTNY